MIRLAPHQPSAASICENKNVIGSGTAAVPLLPPAQGIKTFWMADRLLPGGVKEQIPFSASLWRWAKVVAKNPQQGYMPKSSRCRPCKIELRNGKIYSLMTLKCHWRANQATPER